MHFKEVKDAELWRRIQFTMLEAMVIFIFTIIIGIVNAFDLLEPDQTITFGETSFQSEFTRAELLFHLHSGTIGWLSLSAITIMVWYYVGERDLDESSLRMAKNLLRYLQIVIPIYSVLFYVGFTLGNGEELFRLIKIGDGQSEFFILMVVGAIFAVVGFLWAVYFGFTELRKLEIKFTSHYLFFGAVLTATYGGVFGIIIELQHFLQELFFDPEKGRDAVGAHAPAMESGFLYMFIAGVLEWQLFGNDQKKISRNGWIQVYSLFFAGLALAIGAGFNLEAVIILNLPLLLLGYGMFLGRVLIRIDPRGLIKSDSERFFIFILSGLSITFSVVFFLYVVTLFVTAENVEDIFNSEFIGGFALANEHALFVGGTTSVIFVMLKVMTMDANDHLKRIEDIGFILMVVGLIGFMFTLMYRGYLEENNDPAADDLRTDIAALMGIGLYMIMYAIFSRYRKLRNNP